MKRRPCIWFILLIAAACALVLVWLLFVARWRSYRRSAETVQVALPGFSLAVPETDVALRACFLEECGDMRLTGVTLELLIGNGTVQDGVMRFSYHRYINALRAGGNVASFSATVDPVSGTVAQIRRFSGSARACKDNARPVHTEVLDFPLAWYLERLPGLAGLAPADACWVTFEYSRDGLDVCVLAAERPHTLLYAERLTAWNGTDGFDDREYERTG